jgi:hypothetical protein
MDSIYLLPSSLNTDQIELDEMIIRRISKRETEMHMKTWSKTGGN